MTGTSIMKELIELLMQKYLTAKNLSFLLGEQQNLPKISCDYCRNWVIV